MIRGIMEVIELWLLLISTIPRFHRRLENPIYRRVLRLLEGRNGGLGPIRKSPSWKNLTSRRVKGKSGEITPLRRSPCQRILISRRRTNGVLVVHHVSGINRYVRDEPPPGVTKVGKVGRRHWWARRGVRWREASAGEDEVDGERQSRAAVESILKRSKAELKVKKVALVFRVFEVIACLTSFSVMAADKTQGWSGDSFDRYKEYRYCLFVNIIGFVYSGFQAFDLAYHLVTGMHVVSDYLRYHFNFSMDQILSYLLMSASSSAATRVDDWILNWGQDQFTLMASASVGMSFVAFLAFAISSLISGYNICNRDST
ncbi:CASP-like protein 4A3 [Forsythia ovata]|uniref:CASP-like protein n=1 Tax=Forsythia ovata TaxID=205694 RepID=A0ABD1TSS2_9LAMI